MAQKQATVYILDVGAHMASDAARYRDAHAILERLLHDKAHEGKKKDEIALFLAGNTTENFRQMDEFQGQYPGVFQVCRLPDEFIMETASIDLIRKVHEQFPPGLATSEITGALVWALDLLDQHCKHLKYTKNVFLITDGNTQCDPELLKMVTDKAYNQEIRISVIGFGFDDLDPPEDYLTTVTDHAKYTEYHLKTVCAATQGDFYVAENTITTLNRPRVLQPHSRPYGATTLTLGDPRDPDHLIEFPITFLVKTKGVSVPTLRKISKPAREHERQLLERVAQVQAGGDLADESMAIDNWDDLHDGADGATAPPPPPSVVVNRAPPLTGVTSRYAVKPDVHFRVVDAQGEVDADNEEIYLRENTIPAYRYGKNLIPVDDWEFTSSTPTVKAFEIIAFVPSNTIPREQFMSETKLVIADPKFGLSAALRMWELVAYLRTKQLAALAKYVYREQSTAHIMALFPQARRGGRMSLVMVDLPFAQDVRALALMSLDFRAAMANEGAVVAMPKRFRPSAEQVEAMGGLVGNLMLVDSDDEESSDDENARDVAVHEGTNPGYDDRMERHGSQLLKPKSVVHPGIYRMHRAIEARALDPAAPVVPGEISTTGAASQAPQAPMRKDAAMAQLDPPEHLWANSKLAPVIEFFDQHCRPTKVEPKKRKRGAGQEEAATAADAAKASTIATGAAAPGAPSALPEWVAAGTPARGALNAAGPPATPVMSSLATRVATPPSTVNVTALRLLRPTHWRNDFERLIASRIEDNLATCIAELAVIALQYARAGDTAQAAECVRVMICAAKEHLGMDEVAQVMQEHRREVTPLWQVVVREGLWP
ncbi:ATP-dependent DNA helicase II subunit 2 [Allomyces arbusculus]|nr:ATP-dependent DNA helicase II subunit 2 [Allomyces arbusculus]